MSEPNGDNLRIFPTGAARTRDADGERYDLISPVGLERLARIYAEGAAKYGDNSWEQGFPVSDLMNHGLRHWRLYASGDRSEDHLAKVAWAAFAAMHSESMWPHLNTGLRRKVGDQLNVPPNVDDATAASWRTFSDRMDRLREEYRKEEGGEDVYEDVVAEDDPSVNLYDNLRRMKEGVKAAAAARIPHRYHFLPVYGLEGRCAGYRCDLQWEGNEVVSRWIDGDVEDEVVNDVDLQSCDTAVVFTSEPGARIRIDKARRFNRAIVAVGEPCPDDFPDHFRPERWFGSWSAYMTWLASSRVGAKAAR